jgi:hypothetical protein
VATRPAPRTQAPRKTPRTLTTIQLDRRDLHKMDRMAKRFKVSRVQVLRWVIDQVDERSFLPYSQPVSTVDVTQPETAEVPA